jgi:hypothetical protein
LDIPWLAQPVDATLDGLFAELDTQWRSFDQELRQGKLAHLDFDPIKKTLTWHRPKADQNEALEKDFYAKLTARDITDIFRFVNERCGFLSAMTPLQPRYAKKIADEDSLMAVIIAQAMITAISVWPRPATFRITSWRRLISNICGWPR